MAMQEQKDAGRGPQGGYPMQGHGPNGVGFGQPRQSYAEGGGFVRESRYDDGSMLHPAYNNPEYAK